jgi:hypothetical protein
MLVIGKQAGCKNDANQDPNDYTESPLPLCLDMGECLADEHGVLTGRLIGVSFGEIVIDVVGQGRVFCA